MTPEESILQEAIGIWQAKNRDSLKEIIERVIKDRAKIDPEQATRGDLVADEIVRLIDGSNIIVDDLQRPNGEVGVLLPLENTGMDFRLTERCLKRCIAHAIDRERKNIVRHIDNRTKLYEESNEPKWAASLVSIGLEIEHGKDYDPLA
jgi:hypothetical protein